MTAQTRTRYRAHYYYPGLLFPETSTLPVQGPTLAAAVRANPLPSEPGRGWYAVRITQLVEKLFTADDGERRWVVISQGNEPVDSWVIGDLVHIDDIPDDEHHSILRSNVRANTQDGLAVRTHLGNWQLANEYGHVAPLAACLAALTTKEP